MTYQFTDLVLAVWGRSGCGTNHSGGLIVCQLFDAALSCHYVTHLERTRIKHDGIKKGEHPQQAGKVSKLRSLVALTSRGR